MRLIAITIFLLTVVAVAQTAPAPSSQNPCPTVVAPGKPLAQIKRIFVETFGNDPISMEVQAMVVNSLSRSKVFAVTENRDKADAILKGSTQEKTSQEGSSYSDSTSAGTFGGMAEATSTSSVTAASDARASMRLINGDGDVIWTTTQESKGAKYKGATADVADKIVKQLIRDAANPPEVTSK
jgi:hypothetical protein